MCCPLLFIIILGLPAIGRPFYRYYVNCEWWDDSCDGGMVLDQETYWDPINPDQRQSDMMAELVCRGQGYIYDQNGWEEIGFYNPPPSYIGIVFDQSDATLSRRVEDVLGIINDNYQENSPPSNYDTEWWDDQIPDDYNDTNDYDTDTWTSGWTYDVSYYYGACNWQNFYCLFNGTTCTDSIENTTKYTWTEGSLLKYFSSESELENYVRDDLYGAAGFNFENDATNGALRPVAAAIVFKSISDDGKIWDYSLRFNQSDIADTFADKEFKIVDTVTKDGYWLWEDGGARYQYSGFLQFQNMIDTAITEYIAVEVNEYPYVNNTYLTDVWKGYFTFPVTSYQVDDYWLYIQIPFIILASIMFIYPVIQIINVLVTEKSSKIKEGMKMYVKLLFDVCFVFSGLFLSNM